MSLLKHKAEFLGHPDSLYGDIFVTEITIPTSEDKVHDYTSLM